MAFISIRTNNAEVKRRLRALAWAMTPAAQDKVLQRVAFTWHSRMVLRTPKRWTGQTRRAWSVRPHTSGSAYGYRVSNSSKVMYWLEKGTQAHGSKNGKMLFIPLTRKAAQAGARVVIADMQMVRATTEQGQRARGRFTPGVDFVFAKWVRGIKAMRIVLDSKRFMRASLVAAMKQFALAVTRG